MAVADNYIGIGMYDKICADINLPNYVKKEKRPLTSEEKEAISKADFTNREKAFIYIIYSCGLRRGEALALDVYKRQVPFLPDSSKELPSASYSLIPKRFLILIFVILLMLDLL